jgi:hypothetical protein
VDFINFNLFSDICYGPKYIPGFVEVAYYLNKEMCTNKDKCVSALFFPLFSVKGDCHIVE